jgi:hypothetical protein
MIRSNNTRMGTKTMDFTHALEKYLAQTNHVV